MNRYYIISLGENLYYSTDITGSNTLFKLAKQFQFLNDAIEANEVKRLNGIVQMVEIKITNIDL